MVSPPGIPPPDSFENRLRRARLLRGLSSSEFATKAKKARGSIYQWEGGRTPTMRTVRDLAGALNINIAWLLGGEGPMDSPPKTAKDPVAAESSDSSTSAR